MPVRREQAARGTDTPTPSACGSLWMGGGVWSTPGAAFTYRKIQQIVIHFAEPARTTHCALMERIRLFQMNLSHGLTFRPRKWKTGSLGKALPILSAATMDTPGWRIRLCIAGTC